MSASITDERVAPSVPLAGEASAADRRTVEDARLARLHLRLGMLTAARAELEDLARRDALDLAGLAALAEARWRGGDLAAAAEAARRHLDSAGDDRLAIVVAAEAAAAEGRPGEAQALIERAGPLDAQVLDAVFAGLSRRAYWPSAASPKAASSQPAGPRLEGESGSGVTRTVPGPADVLAATEGLWAVAASRETGEPAQAGVPFAALPPPPAAPAWVEPARLKGHADPDAELRAGRDELAEAPERGLIRLALVLRLDPTLARQVLDAVRLRHEPAARLIRGDAERLLGRHLEAEAEFAEAAEAIERDAIASARHGGHHATREDS